jgi:hypothetical protein
MRLVGLLAAIAMSWPLLAQEFRPFPTPRISPAQWQNYLDEVSEKHGPTREAAPTEKLVVFHNRAAFTTYVFTETGHPAHPAWITRQVVQEGGSVNVRQIGYFAGDEPPFAALFRAYLQVNQRMREEFERKGEREKTQ